ncbi:MAG: metal ABC transporter permease [Gammaproteobacteria bacterium]
MMIPGLDLGILGPPFLAGVLVCITHIPLGRKVLDKGIIFIDLAVAQLAALGVIGASLTGAEITGLWAQLAAALSALIGSGWLHLCERWWPETQEALIGVTFVLAASASLLLLAHNPHGAEHMQDLLSGQILWVSYGQLWPIALLYAVVISLLYFGRAWGRWVFYICFALTVTASVQLVGVYLVFASLIAPALAVRKLSESKAIMTGYTVGFLGYGVGLICSAWMDLPTGPLIVWTLAIMAVIVAYGWKLIRLGTRSLCSEGNTMAVKNDQ